MKLNKPFLLLASLFLLVSCGTPDNPGLSEPTEPESSEPESSEPESSEPESSEPESSEPESSEPESSEPSSDDDKEVNVIFLAGQSNAEGNSCFANIEKFCNDNSSTYNYEQLLRGYEDVKISYHNHYYGGTVSYLYSNRDEPFEPNFVNVKLGQGKSPTFNGPELGMAKYIHDNLESDRPIYIIKYASGGTTFGGTPSWKSPSSGTTGLLFSNLTKYVDNSLEHLTNKGLTPRVRAICWMQGESDSNNTSYSNAYKNNLKNFVSDLRSRYSSYTTNNSGDSIAFVDGLIADISTWKNHTIINDAKKALDSEMPNYYTIDTTTKGLNLQHNNSGNYGGGDAYHYTMDSMLKLGEAFGKTIVDNNCLTIKNGTYTDGLKDFSVNDNVSRPNSFKYEAEHAYFDSKTGIKTESCVGSNNTCVSYFRDLGCPELTFVVNSSKAESKALISASLASATEKKYSSTDVTELPHEIFKTHRLTVNGEPVRLNGTMAPRTDSWHEFKEYSGFVSLKEGVNVIQLHHDKNLTYTHIEERLNVDYIKIDTQAATLTKLNNVKLEAEKQTLAGGITVSSMVSNNPSAGSCVEGLNKVNGTLTAKFTASSGVKTGIFFNFGLASKIDNLSSYLKVELNGNVVSMNNARLPEYKLDSVNKFDFKDIYIGEGNLKSGDNVLKITVLKAGIDATLDYIRLFSSTIISFASTGEMQSYKLEAEDTNYFTPYGNVKVPTTSSELSHGHSGSAFLGGFSYNVGGVDLKFNSNKDGKITLKLCLGLTPQAYNFGECYDIYITNSGNNKTKLPDYDITVPAAAEGQDAWFAWTEFNFGEIDIKAGENIITIDHPIGNPYYGSNLDYVVIETICLIS